MKDAEIKVIFRKLDDEVDGLSKYNKKKSIITIKKHLPMLIQMGIGIHEFVHWLFSHYFREKYPSIEEEKCCLEIERYARIQIEKALKGD